jgi:hypothetical protein
MFIHKSSHTLLISWLWKQIVNRGEAVTLQPVHWHSKAQYLVAYQTNPDALTWVADTNLRDQPKVE